VRSLPTPPVLLDGARVESTALIFQSVGFSTGRLTIAGGGRSQQVGGCHLGRKREGEGSSLSEIGAPGLLSARCPGKFLE